MVLISSRVHVKESAREHCLWPCPYFSSSIPHLLFVWFEWFYRSEVGDRIAAVLWDAASRICSVRFVAFWCNCCQAFSPCIVVSMSCIHIVVWTRLLLGKNCILFHRLSPTSIWPIAYWLLTMPLRIDIIFSRWDAAYESTSFKKLPFRVETSLFWFWLKLLYSILSASTWRPLPAVAFSRQFNRDSSWTGVFASSAMSSA